MSQSGQYDAIYSMEFGGGRPAATGPAQARAIVLPIPFERTTSYVPGTRNGPREILAASTHMELWDEELSAAVHDLGILTMPEMELPFGSLDEVMAEIRRVAADLIAHGAFLVTLGGEHSITPPVVAAYAARYPGLSVLQIDAHADLRDSYMGTPFNHACAMRRSLEHAPCTQVGIRSLSAAEAHDLPSLRSHVFYDCTMRRDPEWMDRVVDTLSDTVYVTIDCDGLDPAIMPAVGTPEPGGLSWYETIGLLRRVFERRKVVGADVVELCPLPGNPAPNFLCAKLVCKLFGYRFALPAAR
ncbi:MAG TPA: agmatinase [Vicinamibacterales bacterium]|nr:agmatinase [Vicinamibacterales bacterium]